MLGENVMSIDAMIRRLEIVYNQMFGDCDYKRRAAYIFQDSEKLRITMGRFPDVHESAAFRQILRSRLNSHARCEPF